MTNAILDAKKFAERVRFGGDTMRANNNNGERSLLGIKNRFYQTDLLISREVTPVLYASIMSACKRLYIPPDLVVAFVYSSAEVQAECFSGSKYECVLRFSSALVDILDNEEFIFVVGHELGHFLFEHGISRRTNNQSSLEFFMQLRFQEISVDRIGLIACGSLEASIRALMKTISGLSSRHLRFDIGSFVSQIRDAKAMESNETASHPSLLVRCRALLWFSLSDFFQERTNCNVNQNLLQLDEKIHSDFHKYIDGPVLERIENVKNELKMWLVTHQIVQRNVFSKAAQLKFSSEFGNDALLGLKNYLDGIPVAEVNDEVYSRVVVARETLESLIPDSFALALSEINQSIETFFSDANNF